MPGELPPFVFPAPMKQSAPDNPHSRRNRPVEYGGPVLIPDRTVPRPVHPVVTRHRTFVPLAISTAQADRVHRSLNVEPNDDGTETNYSAEIRNLSDHWNDIVNIEDSDSD